MGTRRSYATLLESQLLNSIHGLSWHCIVVVSFTKNIPFSRQIKHSSSRTCFQSTAEKRPHGCHDSFSHTPFCVKSLLLMNSVNSLIFAHFKGECCSVFFAIRVRTRLEQLGECIQKKYHLSASTSTPPFYCREGMYRCHMLQRINDYEYIQTQMLQININKQTMQTNVVCATGKDGWRDSHKTTD